MITTILSASLGCTQGEPKGIPEVAPVEQQDTDNTTEIPSEDLAGLIGKAPQSPVGLPTFEVLNLDASPRTQADLLGHRSVIWFYPFANTPG